MPGPRRLRTGLVLGGGGARGAYEAGVVSYLRDELEPRLGRPLPLDVITGTSVGALNACYLAASAERRSQQGREIVEHWTSVALDEVLHFHPVDVLRLLRESFGKPRAPPTRHGGLIDLRGLKGVLLRAVHWPSIGRAIRGGLLEALAISATHVHTGRTFVFIQNAGRTVPAWGRDPSIRAVAARIGPHHALASAAIPLLFPPVRVGGELFVDGGIRLNVPMSPALRLGAQRLVLVTLRHDELADPPAASEEVLPTLPFLVGKTLNALLLDRTAQDVDRLRRINAMLQAGTEAYGPGFSEVLARALVPHRNQPVRYVRHVLVRPSQDIGRLAARFSRSPEFTRRAKGWAGAVIRRLAEREGPDADDLVSYILFDADFAAHLVELGRADARAREAEWVRFWSEEPECEAEAAGLAVT